MPFLNGNTTERFAIQMSGTGTIMWSGFATSQVDQSISLLGGQGVIYAAGVNIIPNLIIPYGAPAVVVASRAVEFACLRNDGPTTVAVTIGKVTFPPGSFTADAATFNPQTPTVTLTPGEAMTYTRENGVMSYDSLGRAQTSSSHS